MVNFFPQFLNATTAAIAAAVAIPLLLLLYFLKLRRVQVPIGSTLLWKKAIQDLQVNSPFQRLRRNLLLLLQLLALLALLFALARPVSEGTSVAGEKTVILIDRSASMNAEDGDGGATRLEEAKQRAKALVNTMGRGAQSMVIAFADEAQTVQPFTGDTAALKGAIDSITPTDRPTRLKTAYTLANANMQFDYAGAEAAGQEIEETPVKVFLFSDGRVPESDVRELSLRGQLTYERIGRNDSGNLAVVAASAKRNYERPTEVQVFARVANYGPEPREGQVRISVAQIPEDATEELDFEPATLQPVQVMLPPARWSDPAWRLANEEAALEADKAAQGLRRTDAVDVAMELGGAAVIRVELINHSDPLTADDVAWVVVPPPAPLRALLVTEGNYFLELLMTTLQLEEPQTITPAEYERTVPTDFDLIVFDFYSPEKLPAAGTFVYSGGLPPADTTNVKPVTQPDTDLALFYEASEVLDWERDHPMLQGLNLNRIWVAEGRLLTLPLGARMLIEGVKGPFLILERNGPRTHLIFSFDLTQSTWPQQKTFPIFGYQMLQYLAAGEDVRVRESIQPGSLATIPPSIIDRAGVERSIDLIGPQGTREVPVDEGGAATLGPFEQVGVYRTEPVLPQFERIAVSLLDDVESNLLPNPTDPGNLSGIDPAQAAAAAADDETPAARNVEWWWWLVAVAAAVLFVEWIVYTRRVGA